MAQLNRYAFPIAMMMGLGISAFLVVAALQPALIQNSPLESASSRVPTAQVTPTATLGAQGRALFVAKGCLVCHNHPAFAELRHQTMALGYSDAPTLANLKMDADYLKRWLHNPRALKPTTLMPNLNLSDEEIDALSAFLLNAPN